jgi:HAD superfamily hydrolase (TIGR01509 family)
LGIENLLEFSLSLDDVTKGKPAPAPYLNALDRLGLHPFQVIAIEDSKTGVMSAHTLV